METVRLGEDVKISRLVHGHWRLAKWNLDKRGILRLVEQCLDLGVTAFDHADIYGDYTCEALFGEALALKPEIRGRLQLITKCGIKLVSKNRPEHAIKHYDTSKEHILRSVDNSLRNFNTDYIDLLLIHRPDPFMDPAETAEAFSVLKAQGKVLSFGVSNFKPSQVDMLSAYLDVPLVTNQIEISPVCLDNFENGAIEQCLERRMPPMAWSPLGGGRLLTADDERTVGIRKTLEKIAREVGTGSVSQVAYAWLLNHPARIVPIVGTREIARVKEAAEALNIRLTRQQWFEVWRSARGKDVD